ncbi:MAG: hypothetical protein AB1489_10410 [Acidobacteriota bacterium]
MSNPWQWDFFIARSGTDTSVAEQLYKLLAPHCRVFLDKYCLKLGDNWDIESTPDIEHYFCAAR